MRLPLLRRTLASGVLLLSLLQAGALAAPSGLGLHPRLEHVGERDAGRLPAPDD